MGSPKVSLPTLKTLFTSDKFQIKTLFLFLPASAISERSSRSTKKSGLDGIEYVPAIAAGGLAGAGVGLLAENALNRSQG